MGANFAYHLYFVNKNNDSVYYIILIIRSIKKYRKNGADFFCVAYKEYIKVLLCSGGTKTLFLRKNKLFIIKKDTGCYRKTKK